MTTVPRPFSLPVTTSLHTNVLWMLGGNSIFAAAQWAIIIVLARLGSPAVVGHFALGVAVTTPVFMLFSLALRQMQSVDIVQKRAFSDYLLLRVATTGLAFVVVCGLSIGLPHTRDAAIAVLLIGVTKVVEALSDVVYGLFQAREYMALVGKSLILRGIMALGSMTVIMYLTDELAFGILGILGVWLAVLLAFDVPHALALVKPGASPWRGGYRRLVRLSIQHLDSVMRLAIVGLPLGVSMLLVALIPNIPRYAIQHSLGSRDLGIYAALMYPAMMGTMVATALGQAISPRLARYFHSGDYAAYMQLLTRFALLMALTGLFGTALVTAFGKRMLMIIYGAEYAVHTLELVLLSIAAMLALIASALQFGITASQSFRIQPYLYGATAVVAAASALPLVAVFGFRGAALSVVVTSGVQMLAAGAVVMRVLRKHMRERH